MNELIDKAVEFLKAWIHRNPARIAAFVTSAVAVALSQLKSDLPADAVTILVLSALGLGEFAQRREDAKTAAALEMDPADLETPAEEE